MPVLPPHLPSKAETPECKKKIVDLLKAISTTNAQLDLCAVQIKQFHQSQTDEFAESIKPLLGRDGRITDAISAIRDNLDVKKAEFMAPMDRNRDDLRQSLQSYQAELAFQRAIIAPIRRVCDDILHEIFLWTVPAVTEVFDHPSYPYRLATVSGKWRTVALSTPPIWSCIPLFSPKGTNDIEDACSRLQTLIARAGMGQVDVDWFPSAQDDQSNSVTIAASEYLLSAVPFNRWRSLRLKSPATIDPWTVSVFDGRYGQLEALQFLHNVETSEFDGLVTRVSASPPHTLQHLKIEPMDHSTVQKYTNFGQLLRSLDLPCMGYKDFGRLDSLQKLTLEHLPLGLLQLPKLKQLNLRVTHIDMLKELKAPLMESFSTEEFTFSNDTYGVLIRSIKDLRVPANCLRDLLRFVTPNITKLVIKKAETTKMTAAEVSTQVKALSEGHFRGQPQTLVIAVPLSLKDILGVLERQTDVVDLTLTFDSKVSWKQRFPSALCERRFTYAKGHPQHRPEDLTFKLCPNLRILTVVLHPSQSDRKYWAQIARKIFEVRGRPIGSAGPEAMWKITCRWGLGGETTWTADGHCSENPEDWDGVLTDTKPRT